MPVGDGFARRNQKSVGDGFAKCRGGRTAGLSRGWRLGRRASQGARGAGDAALDTCSHGRLAHGRRGVGYGRLGQLELMRPRCSAGQAPLLAFCLLAIVPCSTRRRRGRILRDVIVPTRTGEREARRGHPSLGRSEAEHAASAGLTA
jgi:hypothetical protein